MSQVVDLLTHPAVLAILIPLGGGLLGTGLETLGERWKKPGLVALGQRIEGLLADIPKAIRGSRKTAEEKAAPPSDKTPPTGTAIPVSSVPPAAAFLLVCIALSQGACSSLSRPERIRYGVEGIRAACEIAGVYPAEVPADVKPELDEVCLALGARKAEAVEDLPEDAGAD